MIYEIRTYNLKPGNVPKYEALFAEAYPTRQKYSPLFGYFHTEIGPLNQLVHIWAYDNLQQRADIRAAATKDPSGKWPPQGTDMLLTQENDILTPIKGMTEPVAVFELTGASTIRGRLQAAVARGLTQLVGRDTEIEALRRALAGGLTCFDCKLSRQGSLVWNYPPSCPIRPISRPPSPAPTDRGPT